MAAVPYRTGAQRRVPAARAGRDHATHLRLVLPGDEGLAIERAAARRRMWIAARRRAVARRRRIAGTALVALLVGGGWFGLGALRGLDAPAPRLLAGATLVPGGQRYVARTGDTLWSIAERLEPGADPRPLVDALDAQLHGRPLEAGTPLVLPR